MTATTGGASSFRRCRAPDGPPGVPDNNTPESAISGVSLLSPDEGWASGDVQGAVGLLYHYSGGTWHLANLAVDESLSKVWMVSAGEGWAIGAPRIVTNDSEAAVILHYSHGTWTIYKP